jgi:signal transduction histidine kinase/CheY-like chemotaxis protein
MDTTTTQGAALAPRWSASRIAELADWSASPLGSVDAWPPHRLWSARAALGASLPTMLLWGPQLVQIYNEAYRQTFMGDQHPAGMGQCTQECWPEVWHFNEPIYQRVQSHEAVFLKDQEYLLQGSSGPQVHFITLSYDPVEGDDGQVEGILITLLDVTRRVKAERENQLLLDNAQETAKTLQTWFEQAPGFVVVLRGPEHTFEMANKAYCQLVGHRDILGKTVLEALPEVRGQGFDDLLDQVFRTGEAYIGRGQPIAVQQETGGPFIERFLDFVYQPIVNKAGAVVGIFVQGQDVTEQRRALQALHDASQRKDEFLATLAHELRNPLAPIRQAALIAKRAQTTETQRSRSLDMIERQVQNLSLLLDDLMDVSRISSGRLELRKEPVELCAAIRAAIESVQPASSLKAHTLDFVAQPEPRWIQADPLRLEQILLSLLTNAIKYTDRQGAISVEFSITQEWTEVRVRDNGVGLEPEDVEKVFGMFAQVKSALERSEGGLGIGLALSRGLAELHGGTLTATSRGLGKGAEFLLRLPIKHHAAGSACAQAPALPDPRSLLLVDDNLDAVESLAMLLEMDGHSVHVASNGQAALRLAEEIGPDAAIVDIGMPGMNGYEVARRLRSTAWGQKMTLIALTGWGQPEDQRQAFAAGFDHHCTKPADIADLLEMLVEGRESDR